MADRYWIPAGTGGTGDITDTAHWSASSGGAGGETAPTIADRAIFDASSFSSTGQTVTLNANLSCASFDWSAVTNAPTIALGAESRTISTAGSFLLTASMSVTGGLNPVAGLVCTPGGASTFNDGGHGLWASHAQPSYGWTIEGAGSYTLTAALAQPLGMLSVKNGSLISAGYAVDIRWLSTNAATGADAPAINLTNSAVTVRDAVLMGNPRATWTFTGATVNSRPDYDYAIVVGRSTANGGTTVPTWNAYKGPGLTSYSWTLSGDMRFGALALEGGGEYPMDFGGVAPSIGALSVLNGSPSAKASVLGPIVATGTLMSPYLSLTTAPLSGVTPGYATPPSDDNGGNTNWSFGAPSRGLMMMGVG